MSISLLTRYGITRAAPGSGGPGGGTAYRYHRLYFTKVTLKTASKRVELSEVEFRDAIGGADLANGGTATASNSASSTYDATKAFDDDTDTRWITDSDYPPVTLTYDHGAGNEFVIAEYAIRTGLGASSRGPEEWVLQGSNDGTNWTPLHYVTDEAVWSDNEQRTYEVSLVIPAQFAVASYATLVNGFVNTDETAFGWRFETGTAPLMVDALRVLPQDDGTGGLYARIHRASDAALITSALISVSNNGGDYMVAPIVPVLLAADTEYVCSFYKNGPGENQLLRDAGYSLPGTPGFSMVNDGLSGASKAMPTTDEANTYVAGADFRYVVK